MRRLCAATIALACALTLAGCSDGGREPADSQSTWTPTATPESPSTGANRSLEEPHLPPAAEEATREGAEAFVAYYWDLVSYAEQTGDVKALRQASGPRCANCNSGISAIRKHYRAGGKIVGGRYRAVATKARQYDADTAYAFAITATITSTDQTAVNGRGEIERFAGSDTEYELHVIWTGGAWRMDIMEQQ